MIACPDCGHPFDAAAIGADGSVTSVTSAACPGCARPTRLRLFPAAFRRQEAAAPAAAAPAEATCFFHAEKRAVLPCQACGRFLCALCDLEVAGRHLCPTCAARRAADPAEERFVRERTLWDSVALSLATYPMVIFYLTILTAPAAIFIALRHWKSPRSLVPRTRVRFVVALTLAVGQVVGWVVLVGYLAVVVASGSG